MAKPNEYATALEKLERLRASGSVSQAQYDVHRATLLAEASRPRRPLWLRIATFIVIVVGAMVLLRVLAAVLVTVT